MTSNPTGRHHGQSAQHERATVAGEAPAAPSLTAPLPAAPAAAPPVPTTPQAGRPLPRPRTRWAAIVWGLVLAGAAASVLFVASSPARRDGFANWMLTLSPAAIVAYVLLAIGGLVLVAGVVGLIRRVQRGLERPERTPSRLAASD
ncbi:hypothetical protein AB1K54_14430 [Microbacterium sp. BWT-B31]|uniref:hypothetical protein n=1 Tax=Microbacterium sp. BWT-B31 TaxID=3232072 RepID=UPI003529BC0C